MPALRKLHISLDGSVRRIVVPTMTVTTLSIPTLGQMDAEDLEEVVLGPVDSLPSKIERQLVLYHSVYTALLRVARTRNEVIEEERCTSEENMPWWTRFWRPLHATRESKEGYWIYRHGRG
jgi:hypothetical protein